jgi:hypothetical protein
MEKVKSKRKKVKGKRISHQLAVSNDQLSVNNGEGRQEMYDFRYSISDVKYIAGEMETGLQGRRVKKVNVKSKSAKRDMLSVISQTLNYQL